MRPVIDEVGNRYGKLVVIARAPNTAHRATRWECRCDCGNVTVVVGGNLRRGHTRSCGCLWDLRHLSLLERMFPFFTVGDGCWLWHGSTNHKGYGKIKVDGRTLKPHRLIYEALVGAIPEGLEIDHLCRVRNCVRPDHLEPVTTAENLRRGRKAVAE